MLPKLLCEELCSLNPSVDRLAFSVFWHFNEQGEIMGQPRFARTIIRSCAKLSYDHAQAVIEGKTWEGLPPVQLDQVTPDLVKNDIMQLYEFSKILRRKRFENGSLTMNSIKLWFNLDSDGNPINSGIYELKAANRLIEEVIELT